ncbi:hypothetical protein M408DRAFT_159112 [Serendipita vermifera MAFF 305830]|uniref:Uncharacterized protein n=1 Tax=Serendipita vermifera MAFF 305830 TaxID=933852 RepID=A0A0C2XF61_SERVB|nr:hypothetical protein M408DRAFT_159112 [Serendipita vermifera MAFF 305830]
MPHAVRLWRSDSFIRIITYIQNQTFLLETSFESFRVLVACGKAQILQSFPRTSTKRISSPPILRKISLPTYLITRNVVPCAPNEISRLDAASPLACVDRYSYP